MKKAHLFYLAAQAALARVFHPLHDLRKGRSRRRPSAHSLRSAYSADCRRRRLNYELFGLAAAVVAGGGLHWRLWAADFPGPDYPDPVTNPASPVMLAGDWVPENSHKIDFDHLPRLAVRHAVISDVRAQGGVNQHNYLVYHDGRFWAMWSDGPGVEDRVGQVVDYATSTNGLDWNAPRRLTPFPPGSGPGSPHYNTRSAAGFRYIARGFWERDGELLALASLDEAAGFFGPSLALLAFKWDAAAGAWRERGMVRTNTINNFPPKRLPTGEWAMSGRAHDYSRTGVQFLVGGVTALDQWEAFPIVRENESTLRAEEPLWWTLPDGHLLALFRDNGGSHFLFRSFSSDHGRTWSKPVRTNFPDAQSKIHGLRLSNGRYVLVSNPNPKRRDPMTLAVSDDGMVFCRMFYLVGGHSVDYPYVLEHEGYLYIAHSGGKQAIEVERVRIADLETLKMPAR